MIYGVNDLTSAVSTADVSDALMVMATTRVLPAWKSIVDSVAFFMLNAQDSASTYYARKMNPPCSED